MAITSVSNSSNMSAKAKADLSRTTVAESVINKGANASSRPDKVTISSEGRSKLQNNSEG
jgi:hypothetical protein